MSKPLPEPDPRSTRVNGIVPKPKLTEITSTEEFQGWDGVGASNVALMFEYMHAWKEYHQKYSCPLRVNPAIFDSAKAFCEKIGLPFRWYMRFTIQLLDRFPKPWELNFRWIHKEVELSWLEMKHTKVFTGADNQWEIQRILSVHKELSQTP